VNRSPAGFIKGQKAGWHEAIFDSGLQKVKAENKDLKQRLEQLEAIVQDLTTKKTKKSG
jgi:hypothetical protein